MRTIIEDERFQQERDSFNEDTERFDEILGGVYDFLSKAPHWGLQLTVDVWVIGTRHSEPQFLIFYTFDETSVTLRSIRQQESNGDTEL